MTMNWIENFEDLNFSCDIPTAQSTGGKTAKIAWIFVYLREHLNFKYDIRFLGRLVG